MENNIDDLNLIYKVCYGLEIIVNADLSVTVLKKQDHFIQRFLRKIRFNIPEYSKVTLDEYSSFVFLKIDGKNSVADIAKCLDEKYGKDAHPLMERLLLFLNYLENTMSYIKH